MKINHFMSNYFSNLPSELQIKIFLSIPFLKRKPLIFKPNSIVEFNDKENIKFGKEEMN